MNFSQIFSILWPIQFILLWAMYIFHYVLVFLGMPDGPGLAWVLSIVLLTLFVRTCMLPLYHKQLRAQSKMQEIQPKLQAIQKKYKNKKDTASKQKMSRETMALYQEHNANPMGSCLPLIVQGPVLMALYWSLTALGGIRNGTHDIIGPITKEIAGQIEESALFGAKISDTLSTAGITTETKVIIIVFIAIMCITMFSTQFMMMIFNMPQATKEGQQYKMQRMMIFGMPLFYIFIGGSMPLGVLLYWVPSNIYLLCQQLWQIRRHPAFGSKAWERKKKRDEKRNVEKGLNPDGTDPNLPPEKQPKKPQRAQPMSSRRAKKKGMKKAAVVETDEELKQGDIVIIDGKKRRVKSIKEIKKTEEEREQKNE
jgi:YidC/Oxa1 family membrane protein insertase